MLDDDAANLFHLIGLCLRSTRLDIDDIFDTIAVKDVVIAPNMSPEAQSGEQGEQVGK